MPDFDLFLWDERNEEHILQHGVTKEEFEFVVSHTDRIVISRQSGRPMVFGMTEECRLLCCIFDVDGNFCIPVTAYEAE